MGCSCLKDEIKIECENEILQNNNTIDEIIKSNPDLLIQIIKIQGIIKGRFFRKNFYKNTLNINCEEEDYEDEFKNYKQITTDKIDQKELEVLFKLYPSLDDGIEVEVQSPVQFDNGLIYFGEWDKKNNRRHGRGILLFLEGAKYMGCFKNGRACCKGTLIHSDGDIYEGDFLNDKPNGHGIYIHSDGTKFDGEWKNDKQHGKGKEEWPDGTTYEGDYADGKKHGYGIFKWSDQTMYKGQLKIIIYMEKEFILILMEGYMMENGRKID